MKAYSVNLDYSNKPSFKSGLSKRDIEYLSKISPEKIEKYFNQDLLIKSNFKNNQTISVLNLLCIEILKKLSFLSAFSKFPSKPNQIRVYDKNELRKNYAETFCTATSLNIIKNEPRSEPVSLFFLNSKRSIEEINSLSEHYKRENFISSDNFLAFTMHEWMHSIHLNYIYKFNCNNNEKVIEQLNKISSIEFNHKESDLIKNCIGEYAFSGNKVNPFEVFAEGANKIVLSTLDKNELRIKRDINEVINNMPVEFIQLIKKIFYFKI